MHPSVYSELPDGDAMVAELCSKLRKVDVTDFSLEMQIWWRDHLAADRERFQRELQQQSKINTDEVAMLAKLVDIAGALNRRSHVAQAIMECDVLARSIRESAVIIKLQDMASVNSTTGN
jgi:hypothetical protein